jgi:ABC-type Fe3+/spermidine/putrescine transport system ATPase subunit
MYEISGLRFEHPRRSHSGNGRFQLKLDAFRLDPDEKLAVVGANGSGKTTLLRILAFLDKPTSCEHFLYRGREVSPGSSPFRNGADTRRRGIGLLRQHPWLFHGSVTDNLSYPLKVRRCSAGEIASRVGQMCEKLHLSAHALANPRALSGGEQKRVALGRVLIAEPEVLLLDEPMAHLDRTSRNIIEEIIAGMGTCVVFTTHDLHLAIRLSDRTLTLTEGRFCPDLLENLIEGTSDDGTFITHRGLGISLPADHPQRVQLISVGPEAICISPAPAPKDTPNAFPGRIICVRSEGSTVWLEVDAGEKFTIAMSRSSYEESKLNIHMDVIVQFAPDAVHVM